MSAPVYVVLLHYPIANRNGKVVTTAVTNIDIHDISRTACTYGVKGYFLVTPIEEQHRMVQNILKHWKSDTAMAFNPDRVEAVSVARLVKTFDEAKAAIKAECLAEHGIEDEPEVILTDASPKPNTVGYEDFRKELKDPKRTRPAILVFGTGWGVAETFFSEVDRVLPPVYGPEKGEGYNHLSVRAAAAVIMDRLLGY